jgi:general secretion pathway protein H
MRTSAPGSEVLSGLTGRRLAGARRRRAGGFTLIELLVVVALVALASATVSLAVRDPEANQLEREAARLAAVLESARAESRASGVPVWWVAAAQPSAPTRFSGLVPAAAVASDLGDAPIDFRFIGLPPALVMPQRWLSSGTQAVVVGAPALVLGPEPLIGAQRLWLQRGSQRLMLATDGLSPFAVADGLSDAAP